MEKMKVIARMSAQKLVIEKAIIAIQALTEPFAARKVAEPFTMGKRVRVTMDYDPQKNHVTFVYESPVNDLD